MPQSKASQVATRSSEGKAWMSSGESLNQSHPTFGVLKENKNMKSGELSEWTLIETNFCKKPMIFFDVLSPRSKTKKKAGGLRSSLMITWKGVGAKVMAFSTLGCRAAVTMDIKPPMECPVLGAGQLGGLNPPVLDASNGSKWTAFLREKCQQKKKHFSLRFRWVPRLKVMLCLGMSCCTCRTKASA